MKFASEGSLRNMLNDRFNSLTLKDKFGILYYIALKLSLIHSEGLMHKNFHPGNIVNFILVLLILDYVNQFQKMILKVVREEAALSLQLPYMSCR